MSTPLNQAFGIEDQDAEAAAAKQRFLEAFFGTAQPARDTANNDAPPPSFWGKIKRFVLGDPAGAYSGDRPVPKPGVIDEIRSRFPWMDNQTAYLARMLDLFEADDLDEALKHAIRLDGSDGDASAPFHGRLSPRANLNISPHRVPITSQVARGRTLQEQLRPTYEAALDRLVANKQYRQAAFLLIEILGRVQEGLAMLEQHGLYEEAAKVAEGRGAPAVDVVRLWFLAGHHERALQVARVHRAYAHAIRRLETSHPVEAQALRLLWANDEAKRGRYAEAVRTWVGNPSTLTPNRPGRALAEEWAKRAIAMEGDDAADLRYLRLSQRWQGHMDDAAALLEMFDRPEARAAHLRASLGRQMRAMSATLHTTPIVEAWSRAILRDETTFGGTGVAPNDFRLLLKRDRALAADMPSEHRPPPLATPPDRVRIPATSPTGAVPVDALPFGDGNVIVALGPMGLRFINAHGETRDIDEPTDMLVALSGGRCLAVRRLPQRTIVSRVDLFTRQLTRLGSARIQKFSDNAPSDIWFVVEGEDRLVALDVGGTALTNVVWSETWPAPIWAVQSHDSAVVMVAASKGMTMRLVRRHESLNALSSCAEIQIPPGHAILPQYGTVGAALEGGVALPVIPAVALLSHRPVANGGLERLTDCQAFASISSGHVRARSSAAGVEIEFSGTPGDKTISSIILERARHVRLRAAHDATLVVCDDLGRVYRVDGTTRVILDRWDVALS